MGLFDNIKSALGFDGEPDDYDENYEEVPQNNPVPQNEGYGMPRPQNIAPAADNNRVNIQVTAQLQVILVKPEKFSDTKEIANHLNNKKTVVLNLEATTPDVTRRIIDFLGGVACKRRQHKACCQQHIHHHALQRWVSGRRAFRRT